jgi:hypothetical protein
VSRNEREFYWYGSEESEQAPAPEPRSYHFWPTQVLDQLMVFFLALSVVVAFAVLAPVHALAPADPLTRPESVKPQWYFLPVYQLTHYLPATLVATLVVILVVLVVFWPFLDQHTEARPARPGRRRWAMFVIGLLVVLGLLGHWSDQNWIVLGDRVHVDARGIPHRLAPQAPPGAPAPAPPPAPPAPENQPAHPVPEVAPLPAPSAVTPPSTATPLIGQSSAPGTAPPGPPPLPMNPPPGAPAPSPTQP